MHGWSSSDDDETERTSKERRTDDKGSFASGVASVFRGDGDGEGDSG